jgi:hypothetical protein
MQWGYTFAYCGEEVESIVKKQVDGVEIGLTSQYFCAFMRRES